MTQNPKYIKTINNKLNISDLRIEHTQGEIYQIRLPNSSPTTKFRVGFTSINDGVESLIWSNYFSQVMNLNSASIGNDNFILIFKVKKYKVIFYAKVCEAYL